MAKVKKPAIVVAGTILVDIIKTVPVYPEAGRLVQISDIEQSCGGAVPNTAIDLAKLDPDLPVRVFGKVGNDAYGRFAIDMMSSVGLDTTQMLTTELAPTSFTDVINVRGGERTFFTLAGANALLDVDDFDFAALGAPHLHLAYLLLLGALDKPDPEYGCRSARLLAAAKAAGIRTSVDLISEPSDRYKTAVLPALPYIDVLIINELEASAITGIPVGDTPTAEVLKRITEALLALGVREKVILHCPALGVLHDRERGFTAMPSLDLPRDYIVGTTGAGDAFCAGALYGLCKGYTDEELLRLASLTAAASLGAADAVGGMRPLAELAALEDRFGRKELL